ncbi:exosortase B [Duganella aceris]|uniref:Exosortase B n=1 Tax=Duganella aceris TaxID=2703883 RepID=A0ABX0FUH6_9BURK|nr:exosortase B [Duganella aceris]NGZ88035.1 exosortase B [Duganella aceris]
MFWRASAGWLVVLAGLLVLYLPSFIDLFKGPWSTDKNAHGPIVFAVTLWFLWFRAGSVSTAGLTPKPAPWLGYPLLALGLLMFIVGRSQSVLILEVGSLMPVLLALTFIFFGGRIARHLWFAFFFMCFMVPLPGSLVDAATQPLKLAVSVSAEELLYIFGYPVSRAGVIINIGPYQLLVADACSGLNSLFTLEALGLLYLNVMRHESAFRNIVLALLIVPISFASNVTRVIVLSLITFHMGDAAGQGFLHGFSGMVLFLCGLMLIIGMDTLLRTLASAWNKRRGARLSEVA